MEPSNTIKQEEERIDKIIPLSIKNKRKLAQLKHRYNDYLSDDSDLDMEFDALPPLPSLKLATTKKIKKELTMEEQYKLAKAQLKYILRENEMLVDEWTSAEEQLKRLKTEKIVLLDALIKRGYEV